MNYQNKYTFSAASESDSNEICTLFKSQSFEGGIGVQYLRGEDPISSFKKEGDDVACVIVRDTKNENKLIGIGCCIIRNGFINGKVCRIGYLTGLKLHPDYQKKFLGIAKAYEWINENTKEKVDYFYTTILADNVYVQKMLEKKRKNMPTYNYLCDYDTYIFKTGGKKKTYKNLSVKQCDKAVGVHFYKKEVQKRQYSIAQPVQNFLSDAVFLGLYKGEKLIAIATINDQREYKQYVVKKYAGVFTLLRHIPTKLLGYPSFPKINEVVNLSSFALYTTEGVKEDEVKYFVKQILASYTKSDMLIIGLTKNQEIYSAISSMKNICYKSRLYQVSFLGDDLFLPNCKVDVDVAFQ